MKITNEKKKKFRTLNYSIHIRWGDLFSSIIKVILFSNHLLLNGSSDVIDDYVSLMSREEEKDNFNGP